MSRCSPQEASVSVKTRYECPRAIERTRCLRFRRKESQALWWSAWVSATRPSFQAWGEKQRSQNNEFNPSSQGRSTRLIAKPHSTPAIDEPVDSIFSQEDPKFSIPPPGDVVASLSPVRSIPVRSSSPRSVYLISIVLTIPTCLGPPLRTRLCLEVHHYRRAYVLVKTNAFLFPPMHLLSFILRFPRCFGLMLRMIGPDPN
jgi:hypothetical protein